MSREVRRVPVDWKHPVTHNEYWATQAAFARQHGRPASRLHAPTERFVGLCSGYIESVVDWLERCTSIAQRKGSDWTFAVEWHLTGYDCSCHEGASVVHPFHVWNSAGTDTTATSVRDEDHLHQLALANVLTEQPDPTDHMPQFAQPLDELGWCLYETVSEGTPVTPVFATATELVDHLATIGQDYDQIPMRRAAAERLVSDGHSFGSLVLMGGRLLQSDTDADLIAAEAER